MIAGFKEHGFMVAAEHMPDTCTKCPFWLTDLEMQYDGMCFLTGEVIPTPERTCDTKVMGNCPIVPLDRLKKKNTRKEKNMSRPTRHVMTARTLAGILYHTEAQQQQCSEVVTKRKK